MNDVPSFQAPRTEVVLVLSRSRSVTPAEGVHGYDRTTTDYAAYNYINMSSSGRPPKILESPLDSKSLLSGTYTSPFTVHLPERGRYLIDFLDWFFQTWNSWMFLGGRQWRWYWRKRALGSASVWRVAKIHPWGTDRSPSRKYLQASFLPVFLNLHLVPIRRHGCINRHTFFYLTLNFSQNMRRDY